MKIIAKILAILVSVVLIVYASIYLFVLVNKQYLINSINAELKKNVNGDIQIRDINFTMFHHFPSFTLLVHDIYLRGPKYNIYKKDFLTAKKLYISINPFLLLKREVNLSKIEIDQASVYIFRTADGYSNIDVFKQNNQQVQDSTSLLLSLNEIFINNSTITYTDTLKGKFFSASLLKTKNNINITDSSQIFSINGELFFTGLTFNKAKGTYLKNTTATAKIKLELFKKTKQLVILPSTIQLNKSIVNIEGKLLPTKPLHYFIHISTDSILMKEGVSILTETIQKKLSVFTITKPLNVDVKIDGYAIPLVPPKVDLNFKAINTSGSIMQKVNLTNAHFAGTFSNHIDSCKINDNQNSRVVINNFNGNLNGINTKAYAEISNLGNPDFLLKAYSRFDAKVLNEMVDKQKITFNNGEVTSNIFYQGTLYEYENNEKTTLNGILKGNMTIADFAFTYIPKAINVSKLNTTIHYNHEQLFIDEMNLLMGESAINLKGYLSGYIPFFTQPNETAFVKLEVNSPNFDMSVLTQKQKSTSKKNNENTSAKKITKVLDQAIKMLEFDITANAKLIHNNNFESKNVIAKMKLNNNKFNLSKMQMEFAGGYYDLNLQIEKLGNDASPFALNADFKNVDISRFLFSFDNFGQNTITHKNIDGKVNLKIQFTGSLDKDYNMMNEDLVGTTKINLLKGELNNFEPLMRINERVFKKRDFSKIQFAKLETQMKTNGTETDISRMEISSNVLRLFVQGRYSFKDSTDLIIQVPLSNLRKQDDEVAPENIGVDARVGACVHLRMTKDDKGKIKVAYVPFVKKKKLLGKK